MSETVDPPAPRPPAAPPALRVLLVEDNAGDAALVADLLDEAAEAFGGAPPLVEHVWRLSDGCAALTARRFDAVLLDLSLPDAHGLETVERVCAAAPDVPVVVMTGLADDAVAVRAVQAGAQDYLVKGAESARTVARALRYAVERQGLVRGRAEALRREREARAAAETLARDNARLLEEARRAVQARDDVLGIVSHDLRAPLSTVAMTASALRDQQDADPQALAAILTRAAEWALRIVRDLLDASAIDAGRLAIDPEPTTAAAVLEQVAALAEPAAAERDVRLAVACAADARWLEADVDRLTQALGNLVANAIKFSPTGGTVTLAASREHAARPGVAFRVADEGPGIPPEQLPHLFDRFWQARATRRGGAGLGLAIAKGIAEGHGGWVRAESVPGRGSTFILFMPDPADAHDSRRDDED